MQRNGLTRTELVVMLVVGTVLSMALVLFLSRRTQTEPGLDTGPDSGSESKWTSQRRAAQCSVNIDAIKKSMMIFGANNNDYYPNPNNTMPAVGGGAAATSQVGVLSRFAYEMGIKGEMFVCPATEDQVFPIEIDYDTVGAAGTNGSYSYQISADPTRQVTNATENDVLFLADRAPTAAEAGAQTNAGMSPNHNNGEFIMAASKGATVKSEGQDEGGDGEDIGRLRNDIYTQDAADVTTGFTPRDDSYLLPDDAAAAG